MKPYTMFVDSACDMSAEILKEWNVRYTNLTFRFDGDETEYSNEAMPAKEFYDKMRQGEIARTAAANTEQFKALFEEALTQGQDVFYLGFSSGLSGTYNAARIAAEELREAYPDRKIVTFDSLAASAGYGLMLYLLTQKRDTGASMEELAAYAEEICLHIVHWFTVDDLQYLKRGGRISPTVAIIGNMLGIKPVLHVDNEGKLISMAKVRGRKAALKAMADKIRQTALDPKNGVVFISHGDCPDDAEALAQLIRNDTGAEVMITTYVGPVIGAHSGPGTLALFFVGSER